MARPTRLDIPGGWYQVINRGIEGRSIFRGIGSYEHFIGLMAKLPQRFGLRVHGYVLMPNHYHLQVETPRANLSRAIQWLNVSYSIWFNKKYQRSGPLFQGRFKAILHDYVSHGLTINQYIHLNPVRVLRLSGHADRPGRQKNSTAAELAAARREALLTYQWSSYGYYSAKQKAPDWLTTEGVLGLVSRRGSVGTKMAAYRRQLEHDAALGESVSDWKTQLKATMLLGSDKFVERMKKRLAGSQREQTGIRKAGAGSLNWKTITKAVSQTWGQDWDHLQTAYGNNALGAALYFGRNYSDKTLRELGQLAGGMNYPAVTMAVRRFSKRLETDEDLAKKVKRLSRMLLVTA
ncbi:MAG TPA: transposase [Chthoniobacterales bacterium]|nr:transposase [Chthoniobacterales bacterium]